MSDEVREEIHAILMLLKGCLTKNEVSMAFNKKTEELLFFDTERYVRDNRFDGFKVKMEELVK